mgnify:CR=1 FL=1
MSKKKVLLRGVFINRDTNGEGVLKVGTTLIRVSTVMGILYMASTIQVRVEDELKSKSDAPMTEAEMLAKLEKSREQGMFRDADLVVSDMRLKYGL